MQRLTFTRDKSTGVHFADSDSYHYEIRPFCRAWAVMMFNRSEELVYDFMETTVRDGKVRCQAFENGAIEPEQLTKWAKFHKEWAASKKPLVWKITA